MQVEDLDEVEGNRAATVALKTSEIRLSLAIFAFGFAALSMMLRCLKPAQNLTSPTLS